MFRRLRDKKIIFLIFILLLGTAFRVIALSDYPKGFYPQEALLGYRALLLSSSGKDELNRTSPLLFVSSQDYQLPISTYLILPFVKIAGLSKFTVRLPFAIAGVLSIAGIFLLGKIIFKDDKQSIVPYLLAFLMSINPWGVFLSRTTNPESIGLMFFIFGIYFLLKREGIKNFDYLLSLILFSLSLYSDKTAWIFIFSLFIFLLFVNIKSIIQIKKLKIFTTILLLLILCLPMFIGYTKLPQFEKSLKENNFSLFNDIGISNGINQMRGEEIKAGYPLIGKIFYNKIFWINKLSNNVLEHFVPRFYFSLGDQDPIHGLSNFGPLFLILIIPAVYGTIFLIKNKPALVLFILVWLFAAALPSAIMSKTPDQLKFYYSIPVILILVAFGIKKLPKILLFVLTPLLIFNIIYVYKDAIFKEPFRYSQNWSLEFNQVAMEIKEKYPDFDNIFITNKYFPDPIPLYLFSTNYPPEKYFLQLNKSDISYRFWMNKVDKIISGELTDVKFNNFERNLYIVTPQEKNKLNISTECVTGEACYKVIKSIKDKNDKDLLIIVANSIYK